MIDFDPDDEISLVRPRHERLFDALSRCDGEQQVMVAEALRTICDTLLIHDLHSPSSWLVLGLLDGERPVREGTKMTARQRIAGRMQ
jgi:hypothetical protein